MAPWRTPLERLRGRRGRDVMVEFAEAVLYMPLRGDVSDKRRAKMDLEPRFMDGIFLGLTEMEAFASKKALSESLLMISN